ncbi:hypothetical protein Bbelb_028000 [Branchiostoma belcheri]|nr:hypothetical protein Bbelb_028000 [Branchiostoma belcheri]
MKLFVCTLLVTIVVVAMLADDAEAFGPRRRSGSAKLTSSLKAAELREVVEEARSLLDDLKETEQLEAREFEDQEEEDSYQTNGVPSGVKTTGLEASYKGTRPVLGQSPVLTRTACGRVPTGSYSSAGQLSGPWRGPGGSWQIPGGIPTGSCRVFEPSTLKLPIARHQYNLGLLALVAEEERQATRFSLPPYNALISTCDVIILGRCLFGRPTGSGQDAPGSSLDPARDLTATRPNCKSRSEPYRKPHGPRRETDRAPDGSLTETGRQGDQKFMNINESRRPEHNQAPTGSRKGTFNCDPDSRRTLGVMTPAGVYNEDMPNGRRFKCDSNVT